MHTPHEKQLVYIPRCTIIICFNLRGVKRFRFVSFRDFRVFTFMVAESQACKKAKALCKFCGMKLSQMIHKNHHVLLLRNS